MVFDASYLVVRYVEIGITYLVQESTLIWIRVLAYDDVIYHAMILIRAIMAIIVASIVINTFVTMSSALSESRLSKINCFIVSPPR